MATASSTETPRLTRLETAGRNQLLTLLWCASMLGVFTLWLQRKHVDQPIYGWIVAGQAVVAFLLAAWQTYSLWLQAAPGEERAQGLASQRRLIGFVMIALGLVLIILACSLGLGWAREPGGFPIRALRENLGEALSAFLFGIGLLAFGRSMSAGELAQPSANSLERFRAISPLVRLGLFVGSILLGLLFLMVVFYWKVAADYVAETAFLLMLSMACFAAAVYLTFNDPLVMEPHQLRIVILMLGGGFGFLVFAYSVLRSILWRNYFFANLSTWYGDESWRIWVCVYLQLVGLTIMFASLLLARGDVRSNVSLRRALFGFDSLLELLFLLEILVIVNIVFYNLYPYTFDWTQGRGFYALATSSKNLLKNLKEPLHVHVVLSPRAAGYADVRTLMENFQAESSKVTVHYLSPDANREGYANLASLFPKALSSITNMSDRSIGRGVLLVYGNMPENPNHRVPYAFVPDRKLADIGGGPGMRPDQAMYTFKGEIELVKELDFLLKGQEKRRIYFLQEHGELDMAEMQPIQRHDLRIEMAGLGAAKLVDRLKSDNYDVKGLTFSNIPPTKKNDDLIPAPEMGSEKRKEVPTDAHAVVIAGASQNIAPETLSALERYTERGGKLFVGLDLVLAKDHGSFKDSGLETWLKKFGVDVGNEFVMAYIPSQRTDIRRDNFLATPVEKSENTIAKQFAGTAFPIDGSRVVKSTAAPGRYKVEPLFVGLRTREEAPYTENDIKVLRDTRSMFMSQVDPSRRPEMIKKLQTEAPTIAVAVSEEEKPRMVVFGDSEFLCNANMFSGKAREESYSLFISCLEWMSDREGPVGMRPKTSTTYSMSPGADTFSMIVVPTWLMFLFFVGTGVAIWIVRRR